MDENTKALFDEAKQYANKGDNYAEAGNFDYASKCYFKVSKILDSIVSNTNNDKTIQELRTKIKKYTDLAEDMIMKQKKQ